MKKPDTTRRLEEALSETNAEEREGLRAMWRLSANADESPPISNKRVDALWQTLAAAAAEAPDSSAKKQDRPAIRRKGRTPAFRLWSGAGVAMVVVVTGIALWLQPLTKTAPYGEQLALHLPDGSAVELNSGSSISYPRFFSGTRAVSLDGEAYFDVQESTIPFIVEIFNADVEVLGTTFNVKARENGWRPESQITLTSGSVRLSTRHDAKQSLVMIPGQTVTIREGAEAFLETETETTEHVLAWRKGELVFKNEALILVLEEIERRFDIDVKLQVNQLAEKEVTFAYRQATSAESVIEDLCHALNVQYRPIANGYELFEE